MPTESERGEIALQVVAGHLTRLSRGSTGSPMVSYKYEQMRQPNHKRLNPVFTSILELTGDYTF